MDLKSMLNDSAGQRPTSLHTHHPSYDARAIERNTASDLPPRAELHAQTHLQSNRPLPCPPPLQPVDSRGLPATGSHFGGQSPHPSQLNSASSTHTSTTSGGPHSANTRSPGTHSQPYTPRENAGTQVVYNASFVPSPSLSVTQPPTPGSAYQHQNHTPISAHSQTGQPPPFAPAHSPRGSNPPNGYPRQVSPNSQHPYSQPATPLGPPISYNKISPQAQRPPSQGRDQHYRHSSYGSVGSLPGREHSVSSQQPLDTVRSDSLQRQAIPDLERVKERERSISVSPKTIPQPSPYRQLSISSQAGSQGRPSVHSPPEARAMSNISEGYPGGTVASVEVKLENQQTPTPRSSTILVDQPHQSFPPVSMVKQESYDTSSPSMPSQSLKRNASFMSDQSHSSQTRPRKRPKRDEIPIFARSMRQKPLRLGTGGQMQRQHRPPGRQPQQSIQQGHQQRVQKQPIRAGPPAAANGKPVTSSGLPRPSEVRWEHTIANIAPYEDLTRRVCDWIHHAIGMAVPPGGGAMFEIEAKIGEIFDTERGHRLVLPVETEAIFNPDKWPSRTKFESSMNVEQHKLLNQYLNELTRDAFVEAQKGERQEIVYDHPYEVDEFFELTAEGRQNLNPSILEYLTGPRHKPRVRRTRDRNTGQVKAQIIKSRIADLEIYNPGTDFDCRISISIESPWEGNPNWLTPMGSGNEGRHKDRMSYRHMAYQIDLTQVSHDNQPNMEHELEIEISTEQIRVQLDNLQNGRPSKYEDLVRGLIDNVRLLCRKGSMGGQRRA